MDRGLRHGVLRGAEPPAARRRGPSLLAAHGFVADVAVVEVDRETGEVEVLDYVTVHDAGRLLNPLLAEGQARRPRPRRCSRALRAPRLGRGRNLLTGSFMDYLAPTAPDLPTPTDRPPRVAVAVPPARRKGLGEGTTMPAAIANARGRPRARRRRAAVHTRSRLGAAAAMKPAPFDYVRPKSLDDALAALAEHDDAKVLAGGQSLVPR